MQDLDRLKAQVSPGNPVSFEFRGQRLDGIVATLGPKRAVVAVAPGDSYRVPYECIRFSETPEDHSAKEQGALERCRKLLREHRLNGWSARLDDSMARAAACNYDKKQLSFARLFLRKASEEEILDTILHEIAHALAGFKHHHDAVWRKIAREIGCTGKRCHDMEFSPPRWIMYCPGGCFSTPRNRRAAKQICLRCRQPVRFVSWTKEPDAALGDGATAGDFIARRLKTPGGGASPPGSE